MDNLTLAHFDDGTSVTLDNSAQLFDIPESACLLPLKEFVFVYAVVEGGKVVGWTNKFVADNFFAKKGS